MVPKGSQNGAQNALFGDLFGHWALTPVFISFSDGFGSFLSDSNLESVWYLRCLLKIITFGKRSVFEPNIYPKKLLFWSQNDAKRDQKRDTKTSWI